MTFKAKAYEKLLYYKDSSTEMIENKKVVTVTARGIFRYIEELEKMKF